MISIVNLFDLLVLCSKCMDENNESLLVFRFDCTSLDLVDPSYFPAAASGVCPAWQGDLHTLTQ